jgi:hypothetical protein
MTWRLGIRVIALFVVVLCAGSCTPIDGQGVATAGPSSGSGEETSESESPVPTDRAPNVSGLVLTKARTKLQALDVTVTVEVVRKFSHAKRGTVLRQRPPAHAVLSGDTLVQLVVAKPFPHIPGIVGKDVRTAKKALLAAGYKVKVVLQQTTTTRDEAVTGQSPDGGSEALPGRTVTIVVANNTCTPGYSPCLPLASDYDCAGGEGDGPKYVYGTVRVTGYDPYDLDRDNDGYGCDP